MSDLTTRLAELEADNRRLRRLLDQRDAPGELRHRLRSTVAMLRMIIRKSTETERDIEMYVGHVEDRMDALARAQAQADESGGVDLHKLIADELSFYRAGEGEQVSLTGPRVILKARGGQVFGLAIHELAVNAVEHGDLGTRKGRLDVEWSVVEEETDTTLTLTWQERDATGVEQPTHYGFGMEVLTKMLRYELDARTVFVFEQDGFRCTIRVPLTEKVGTVEP
ncbi:HWE histidine kinase domain-containing protein [Jiella marina]|uniref:HWE histidine kinase domain-containing protein n=1 Tax=Jiella sp. LLJ827 TaxID=2917712 RepID=UPI002101D371|nr:HWE histidine kinase domain-containing protein [Jiella sp. LLJ827]MCQ0989069.1 sensor histidine kinase [Jiella sp. LLJ827]